jgi:hypothetical protein
MQISHLHFTESASASEKREVRDIFIQRECPNGFSFRGEMRAHAIQRYMLLHTNITSDEIRF